MAEHGQGIPLVAPFGLVVVLLHEECAVARDHAGTRHSRRRDHQPGGGADESEEARGELHLR